MARGYDIAEFTRRLQGVPKAVRARVDAANETSAAEWVRASKAAAPKDPKDGTPLADSIRHERTPTGGQIVRAGGSTTTKPSAGGPFDYARAAEFGTVEETAQPFFWPIYRLLRKKIVSRRRRALRDAFKEAGFGN
jgi:HK97 gp10 family phage protein